MTWTKCYSLCKTSLGKWAFLSLGRAFPVEAIYNSSQLPDPSWHSSYKEYENRAISTTFILDPKVRPCIVLSALFLNSKKRSSQYNISAGRLQEGSICTETSILMILKVELSVQHIWRKASEHQLLTAKKTSLRVTVSLVYNYNIYSALETNH